MSMFSNNKKSSSLDTFKTAGAITTAILALNKAIKESISDRKILRKKQQQRDHKGMIIAGFVGGDLRHRVSSALEPGNGHDEDAILDEARQKAEALAARAKAQAANAEKDMNDN